MAYSIRWNESYSLQIRIMSVDKNTWVNKKELTNVIGVSIHKTANDEYPLLESGDMQFVSDTASPFENGWYRIEALFQQGGVAARLPLATLMFASYGGTTKWNYTDYDVQGYSVLKPLEERVLRTGEYIPKGENVSRWIANKIKECTPAPVLIRNGFTLTDPLVFASGTSYLQAIWTALDAKGYVIQIDGNGRIIITKMPSNPALVLDSSTAGLIVPEISWNADISNIPNRYYAVSPIDGTIAVARNVDVSSPTSYQKRGRRWVDYFDDSPSLTDGESIDQYARRKLQEVSDHFEKINIEHEFVPDVTVFDKIRCYLPNQNIEGLYVVEAQELSIGNGITIKESLSKESGGFKEY